MPLFRNLDGLMVVYASFGSHSRMLPIDSERSIALYQRIYCGLSTSKSDLNIGCDRTPRKLQHDVDMNGSSQSDNSSNRINMRTVKNTRSKKHIYICIFPDFVCERVCVNTYWHLTHFSFLLAHCLAMIGHTVICMGFEAGIFEKNITLRHSDYTELKSSFMLKLGNWAFVSRPVLISSSTAAILAMLKSKVDKRENYLSHSQKTHIFRLN